MGNKRNEEGRNNGRPERQRERGVEKKERKKQRHRKTERRGKDRTGRNYEGRKLGYLGAEWEERGRRGERAGVLDRKATNAVKDRGLYGLGVNKLVSAK